MIREMWQSFQRLPLWVRLWVLLLLGPVNVATILFLDAPLGGWIAVLAYAGMIPNLVILVMERGVSRLMALPHLIFWTPMLVLVAYALTTVDAAPAGYLGFLVLLLIVDAISLAFDLRDFRLWLKGAREVF